MTTPIVETNKSKVPVVHIVGYGVLALGVAALLGLYLASVTEAERTHATLTEEIVAYEEEARDLISENTSLKAELVGKQIVLDALDENVQDACDALALGEFTIDNGDLDYVQNIYDRVCWEPNS